MNEVLDRLKAMLEPMETPALIKQATMWSCTNSDAIRSANSNLWAQFTAVYIAGALGERERLRHLLALEGPTLYDGAPERHEG
jgi:hypothetical protein